MWRTSLIPFFLNTPSGEILSYCSNLLIEWYMDLEVGIVWLLIQKLLLILKLFAMPWGRGLWLNYHSIEISRSNNQKESLFGVINFTKTVILLIISQGLTLVGCWGNSLAFQYLESLHRSLSLPESPTFTRAQILPQLKLVMMWLKYSWGYFLFAESFYSCSNPKIVNELSTTLARLPDLDKMLNGLSLSPRKLTAKTARVLVDWVDI
jgi:hypothetical protein